MMGHDGPSTGRFFFSFFIFRHTRKRTRGVGFGLGLGCWFITFFLFFLERMYGSLRFRVV